MAHDALAPSEWVTRWAPLIARGTVLDVASGSGRHAKVFLEQGLNGRILVRKDNVGL